MDIKSPARLFAVVSAAAILTAAVQYHVVANEDHAPAAATEVTATLGATRIVALRETASSTTTSRSYQTLAATSISVPPGQRGLMVAHFAAESLCRGLAGYCSARIRMDGIEMVPQSGTNFAFDSAGGDARESHAMERTISGVSEGIHVFAVEWTLVCYPTGTDCPRSFSVDDWVFDVEFWRQS
ncbi:MAG TPA: hypothetical protein VFJ14_13065 [Nocardioidaceae bacterium]|nr:hypothetical protein [Nocardioidaceae bacterium]